MKAVERYYGQEPTHEYDRNFTIFNPNFNNGNCYVSNFSRDMYYVLSDCDVSMIYMRRNNNLVMKCKIFPNHKLYQQFTYDYVCSLDNLTSEKLNFAFSAEDAIVTINSLKY